jgi:hypothetical protein
MQSLCRAFVELLQSFYRALLELCVELRKSFGRVSVELRAEPYAEPHAGVCRDDCMGNYMVV